jgi:hypothetical protein
MKRLVARCWFCGLFLFVHTVVSQGTVAFNNDSNTRITNCASRLPQPTTTIKVGLYFTPDLSAVSNAAARASMALVRVTTNGPTDGRFVGGTVTLPGVPAGASVVFQVKAWPTNYVTFEEAAAGGAEVAESLPWVQQTGGGVIPPSIISKWGFRPFLFPQCERLRVPLFVERNGTKLRVCWPVGVPPNVQVLEAGGTNWQNLMGGVFVNDHWEFETEPTAAMRFFRLAQ